MDQMIKDKDDVEICDTFTDLDALEAERKKKSVLFVVRDEKGLYIYDEMLNDFIPVLASNVAGGLLRLNGDMKIDSNFLPASTVLRRGNYDIIENLPELSDATGDPGDYYSCINSGSRDFGHGVITVEAGDWLVHNGEKYERSIHVGYTKTEMDNMFLLKTGDIMSGPLEVEKIYVDTIGNGMNDNIIDVSGADVVINKNVDMTNFAILASEELHSNVGQFTNLTTTNFTTGNIKNSTDGNTNISLTNNFTIFNKDVDMNGANIKGATNIITDKLSTQGISGILEMIDFTLDTIKLMIHMDANNNNISNVGTLDATNVSTANLTVRALPTGMLRSISGAVSSSLITNNDISAVANISDSKLNQIVSADKVANSATSGTSTNTNNTLVLRGASGEFSMGALTTTGITNSGSTTFSSLGTGILHTNSIGVMSSSAIVNSDISASAGIVGSKLANNTITATQIASATITATQIANATITGTQIANATITDSLIASNTISNNKLVAEPTSANTANKIMLRGASGECAMGALTCGAINTQNNNITMGSGDLDTNIVSCDRINLRGANQYMEFGYGVVGKEAQAGKMGYGIFTADTLDIVGGGTTSGSRTVKIWDDLIVPDITMTNVVGGTVALSGNSAGGLQQRFAVKNTNGNYNSRSSIIFGQGANDLNFDGYTTRLTCGHANALGRCALQADMIRSGGTEQNLFYSVLNTLDGVYTDWKGSFTLLNSTGVDATLRVASLGTGVVKSSSNGTFSSSLLANSDFTDNTISGTKITDATVSGTKITDATIADAKLSSVVASNAVNNSICKRDATGQITASNLFCGNITLNSVYATGGTQKMVIDGSAIQMLGTVRLNNFTSSGIVKNDAVGNLSSALITNSDVSASAGIVDTKLATIATAGKVSNSATTGNTTNSNNTLVLRDASGNFASNVITANDILVNGNACTIELGANVAGKDFYAGKIEYQPSYSNTFLTIVGAGSGSPNRKIKLFDQAEVTTSLTTPQLLVDTINWGGSDAIYRPVSVSSNFAGDNSTTVKSFALGTSYIPISVEVINYTYSPNSYLVRGTHYNVKTEVVSGVNYLQIHPAVQWAIGQNYTIRVVSWRIG